MQTSQETIDLAGASALLGQGCRVALFIRHSERPPIRPDDKEFGRTLELTPRGQEMARAAGRRLAGVSDARFYASPMTRCQMTARCFAEGMGLAGAPVEDADPLGVRSHYYADPYAVQDLMRQRGYMAYMLEYLRDGVAPFSNPIRPATERTAAWLRERTTTRLGVFVSHDIFIAAFLTCLGVRTYTAENWVGYLHGAALVHSSGAGWVCHACVPDLEELVRPAHFVH
jgi:broad specificity phosphatase PhoE